MPNAADDATSRALKGLCKKGLLKFKWEEGNRDGRYQALPLGKAAFSSSLEPDEALAVQKELDRCAKPGCWKQKKTSVEGTMQHCIWQTC